MTRKDSGSWTDAEGRIRPTNSLPLEAVADPGGGVELPRERLGSGDFGIERLQVGRDRLQRKGADRVGQEPGPLDGDYGERAQPDGEPVGADQGQPVFRSQLAGCDAGPRHRLASRPDLPTKARLPSAGQDQTDGRHLHQVRGADRATLGHDGVHAGVQHLDQPTEDVGVRPRAAVRQADDASNHEGADVLVGKRIADPPGVHGQDLILVVDQVGGRDLFVPKVPDVRVQAVELPAVVQCSIHHRSGHQHSLVVGGVDLQLSAFHSHVVHLLNRQPAAGREDDDRAALELAAGRDHGLGRSASTGSISCRPMIFSTSARAVRSEVLEESGMCRRST